MVVMGKTWTEKNSASKRRVLSLSVVSNSLRLHGLQSARLLYPWGFSRQEYWSGLSCLSPVGIFPTQGRNPGLLHCRWILYHLSHQGSFQTEPKPKITKGETEVQILPLKRAISCMGNFKCYTIGGQQMESFTEIMNFTYFLTFTTREAKTATTGIMLEKIL